MEERKICCICGQVFIGYGNDPWPVEIVGECCDQCNAERVIPARLKQLKEKKDEV